MKKMLSYGLYVNMLVLIFANVLAIWRGWYVTGFILTIITAGVYIGAMYFSRYVEQEG